MNVINSYPPATAELLARCESQIGRRIPDTYRLFLQRHNGGRPMPHVFEHRSEHGRLLGASVRFFFGVHDRGGETHDSLAYCAEMYLKRDRVPHDLFPIAADGGSNLILLGTEGERKEQVFFWDHNWEAEDGEPPTYRNVHPLADSFDAFLAMLHE